MAKRGRPEKDVKRDRQVMVRMSEAEYQANVAAATAAGVTLSEWLRTRPAKPAKKGK